MSIVGCGSPRAASPSAPPAGHGCASLVLEDWTRFCSLYPAVSQDRESVGTVAVERCHPWTGWVSVGDQNPVAVVIRQNLHRIRECDVKPSYQGVIVRERIFDEVLPHIRRQVGALFDLVESQASEC